MTINPSSQEKLREQLLIVGCGDIGQRLAYRLDPSRYQVTGLRRNPPANQPWLTYQVCDATQADQLDPIIQQGFAVIVISMTPAERSDASYERAYVQTCHNLIASLKRQAQQPRLIIFVSSTAVYAQDNGSWVDENSLTQPESFSGKRLLEAEQVVQESGFAHSIVRFSGIYGPGRNRLIEQVKQGRASASPHITNRIHAEDCAGVLAHLIDLQNKQEIAGLYVATDSYPAPMFEVVSWIAQRLGIENFVSPDAVNERGNKRISNQHLLATGYQLQFADFRSGYGPLVDEQK